MKSIYLTQKESRALLLKMKGIARRKRRINQHLKELRARLDASEQGLETCPTSINTCIDFIPFKTPPATVNWATLYVYATRFKDGYYLSAN